MRQKNNIIHVDPGYIGYFENQGIHEGELEEKADLIMVTHFHKDHLKEEASAKIHGEKTVILAPKIFGTNSKFKTVKPDEEISFSEIKIKVVDAYNTPRGILPRNSIKKERMLVI